jgi:hypothetical protein
LAKRAPAAIWLRLCQGYFDLGGNRALRAVAQALPEQARGNNLGGIDHQQITGAQNIGQIGHMAISNRIALRQKQPRGRARAHRAGGNQLFRQGENRNLTISSARAFAQVSGIRPLTCPPSSLQQGQRIS